MLISQVFVAQVNVRLVIMGNNVTTSVTVKIILPVTQIPGTVFVREAGLEQIVANLVRKDTMVRFHLV
jgi:hypothetical protein